MIPARSSPPAVTAVDSPVISIGPAAIDAAAIGSAGVAMEGSAAMIDAAARPHSSRAAMDHDGAGGRRAETRER
jgi:hypothetical protein